MKILSDGLAKRLAQSLVLSILVILVATSEADAHELNPTVADLAISDGTLTIDLRLNAEAFLADLDLDGLSDTNESASVGTYDQLQDLPGEAIQAQFTEKAAAFASGMIVTIDGGQGFLTSEDERQLSLTFQSISTPAVSIPEIARQSLVQFTATVPTAARSFQISWKEGYGQIVIRQQGVDEPFTGLLFGGETTPPITISGGAALSAWESFTSYIPVGFDHILPKGLDHILFVLGLFFLSLRMGALLWQVTAFTAAHTVTLALGALGVVNVPGSIVEPIIAASIVYVGVENILSSGLNKWRPMVVFGFGLLHGLGFASVLGEFGLPTGQFVPALLGFNVGVELGQLTVIAIAFLAVGLWFGKKPWYKGYIANPASAAIALVGAYWVIERVFL